MLREKPDRFVTLKSGDDRKVVPIINGKIGGGKPPPLEVMRKIAAGTKDPGKKAAWEKRIASHPAREDAQGSTPSQYIAPEGASALESKVFLAFQDSENARHEYQAARRDGNRTVEKLRKERSISEDHPEFLAANARLSKAVENWDAAKQRAVRAVKHRAREIVDGEMDRKFPEYQIGKEPNAMTDAEIKAELRNLRVWSKKWKDASLLNLYDVVGAKEVVDLEDLAIRHPMNHRTKWKEGIWLDKDDLWSRAKKKYEKRRETWVGRAEALQAEQSRREKEKDLRKRQTGLRRAGIDEGTVREAAKQARLQMLKAPIVSADWSDEKVKLMVGTNRTTLEKAKVLGGLAVHRSPGLSQTWDVSHVKSGLRLPQSFGTEESAQRAVMFLQKLADWEKPAKSLKVEQKDVFDVIRSVKNVEDAVDVDSARAIEGYEGSWLGDLVGGKGRSSETLTFGPWQTVRGGEVVNAEVISVRDGKYYVRVGGKFPQTQIFDKHELASEREFADKAVASHRKQQDVRTRELEEKQRRRDVHVRKLSGFLGTMPKRQAARADAFLQKQVSWNREFKSRLDHVRSRVGQGWRVITTRGKGRVFQSPDESFFLERDIGKTAMDFAEHLVNNE